MSITRPLENLESLGSPISEVLKQPREVVHGGQRFRVRESYNEDDIYQNRSYDAYMSMLFPDHEEGEKRGAVKAVSLEEREIVTTRTPLVEMGFLCGGRREFFSEGAQILDIGSGGGKALLMMNELYGSRGVKVIGLDDAYKDRIPNGLNAETAIAGNWREMPFEDNGFDRFLSCESNLKWLGKSTGGIFFTENDIQTIDEVTRVAREGAIWRATFSGNLAENKLFIQTMVNNDWKVFFYVRTMIAQLVHKKSKKV